MIYLVNDGLLRKNELCEMKKLSLSKTHEKKTKRWKIVRVNFEKSNIFRANFWKPVFFNNRTILLNERFYWMIVQWEKEIFLKDWKKNDKRTLL